MVLKVKYQVELQLLSGLMQTYLIFVRRWVALQQVLQLREIGRELIVVSDHFG